MESRTIKAKPEHIKIAYDELIEELNNKLTEEKEELEKFRIENIKLRIERDTFSYHEESEEKTKVLNLLKESDSSFVEKYDFYKERIEKLKQRIEYLRRNEKSILGDR